MKKIIKPFLLFFIILTFVHGSTRVAYLRPGPMMKIPYTSLGPSPYLFTAGFGTEIHNLSPFNTASGAYGAMEMNGWTFGFSTATGGDTTSLANLEVSTYRPPVEFGFHFQQRIFTYNDISLSAGLQDIVFQNNQDDEQMLSLNTDLLSFFVVLASEKDLGDYKMSTFMGFGTGGLGPMDSVKVISDSVQTANAGVFVGFLLKTPYFGRTGGMDIVGEFDGTGVNVGLRIPLTSDYRLNLGFTHMEKLPEWGNRYWSGHPGFTLGLDMAVPRDPRQRVQSGPSSPTNIYGPGGGVNQRFDDSIPIHRDSTVAMANVAVSTLRDSMALMNNEMRNLLVRLNAMEQNSKFLSDSLTSLKLETNVSEKNMNEAMRFLSRSLRFFYAGDYREALKEVDLALELNPDLALAYARRGSIYYKLGDVQRATINWNLALRLDPEYTDVRNILKALNENKLKSTSIMEE